ncbi:MAG: 4Fe-4S binding protein [bacterium]|nr:4Fe-4S binding protein [bacterium]
MLQPALIVGSFGAVFSTILAIAYAKLNTLTSEKESNIMDSLPGGNCGTCGFADCEGYGKALAKNETEIGKCRVGGDKLIQKLSEILSIAVPEHEVAALQCGGGQQETSQRFEYHGIMRCDAANIVSSGPISCTYGCIGFGDCVKVCNFNAISMEKNGLPAIDEKKCTGCGLCVKACQRDILILIPKEQKLYMGCNSPESNLIKKSVCKVGCITCGLCVSNCPYKAIEIKNGRAEIEFELCKNCGICIAKCSTHAIVDKLKARPKAIIGSNCTGCEKCKEECPIKAIEGLQDNQHKVILEKCIGCGLCYKVCKPKAITMAFSLGYVEP